MCYAKPGPRCSGHARKTLTTKEQRLQQATEDVKASKQEHENDPENVELKKQYISSARKYKNAKSEFKLAQRDYDGTPGGRKDLHEKLSGKVSAKQRVELTKRIRAGKMMYNWRKHQLDMKKLEKSTGLSLKTRRGKFLTAPGGLPAVA